MKFLITGATGFVGFRLLKYLIQTGHEVVAVARGENPLAREHAGSPELTWVRADIRKPFQIDEAVNVVVHAASLIGDRDAPLPEYLEHNVEGTKNVLRAARTAEATQFVYLSSLSVYGDIQADIVDWETPHSNPGAYGLSKYLGEELVREESADMSCVCLRLPGILPKLNNGPWLAKALMRARAGQPIELFNPEAPFNNAVDREDLVEFISSLATLNWSGHEVITMGASEARPLGELIELMVHETGSSSEMIVKPCSSGSFQISNERAITCFGYRPRPIEDMVRRLMQVELQSTRS